MMDQKSVVAYDTKGKIIAVAQFGSGYRETDKDVYVREGFNSIVVDELIEYSRTDICVIDRQIAIRPTFSPLISAVSFPADGLTPITISDLPEGAIVNVSGPINESWQEPTTSTEFTVDLPGTYRVLVECWPYQDAEVTFDAT